MYGDGNGDDPAQAPRQVKQPRSPLSQLPHPLTPIPGSMGFCCFSGLGASGPQWGVVEPCSERYEHEAWTVRKHA